MYRRIDDFINQWQYETEGTRKALDALTDMSLSQEVVKDHRTLGRMAWHLVTTIPEMMNRTGLTITGVDPQAPVPTSAAAIGRAYVEMATSLADEIRRKWQGATLDVEDDMYGEKWKRGATLAVLLLHQAHHRGQMTVLMRQAGLKVPGIYGPSLEEWSTYGQPAPAV